jgi:transposase
METTRKYFDGQDIYVGIDVHKKRWVVTVRWQQMEMKTFSMDPSARMLAEHLLRHYPGGTYHSVYEAGFCGFHIHTALVNQGIDNLIVNPGDVPRIHKERLRKSDPIDSRKLARELEHHSLKGIYIPDEFHQQLRSLCRLRERLTSDSTRWKNRIKSYLAFYGVAVPEQAELSHWSNRFMGWLEGLRLEHDPGTDALQSLVRRLRSVREELAWVLRRLRHYARTHPASRVIVPIIQGASGVGFITAITFYTEIIDMRRFSTDDKVASFVGLVPTTQSSGEWETEARISSQHHATLRFMLIEAAWVAVRKDPAMSEKFAEWTRRMPKNVAIVRVAKALVKRIRHVWLTQQPYVTGLVA